jgi:hypothetical protein
MVILYIQGEQWVDEWLSCVCEIARSNCSHRYSRKHLYVRQFSDFVSLNEVTDPAKT